MLLVNYQQNFETRAQLKQEKHRCCRIQLLVVVIVDELKQSWKK